MQGQGAMASENVTPQTSGGYTMQGHLVSGSCVPRLRRKERSTALAALDLFAEAATATLLEAARLVDAASSMQWLPATKSQRNRAHSVVHTS